MISGNISDEVENEEQNYSVEQFHEDIGVLIN